MGRDILALVVIHEPEVDRWSLQVIPPQVTIMRHEF